MGLAVNVPAGAFAGCVEVTETTSLDCGSEDTKLYCPGVGLVVDAEAELADYQIGDDGDDGEDDEESDAASSWPHRAEGRRSRD